MRVVHLCRKPLSEGSVAKNTLRHGTGALNIDASRVHGGPSSGGSISGGSALGQDSGWNAHENRTTEIDRNMSQGRWPANLILQHRPGCRVVGTKKVRAKQLTAGCRTIKWGVGEGGDTYQKGEGARFATSDGMEEAPVWSCEPGCPSAEMDSEVGGRPSTWTNAKTRRVSTVQPESKFRPGQGNYQPQGQLYGDSGGPSRFFKQVGGANEP